MYLDFTNDSDKISAFSTIHVNYENEVTPEDAFFVILRNLDFEIIDNLCAFVAKETELGDPHIIYNLIESNCADFGFRKLVLNSAYELIHSGKPLGNKMSGAFNSSSWISHSLYEGEVASQLAEACGLNPDVAKKLGILHDIGRKIDHSFKHTIIGYELLRDAGYENEAVCCLTHSFLSVSIDGINKGNRCANCDPSIDGFYINDKGQGVFKDDSRIDDITTFLESYQYNPYDIILNISDLMATSSAIISPYDRMLDVYTRKTPDLVNSPFFKVCFINHLNNLLYSFTNDEKYNKQININDMQSIGEIDSKLKVTSDSFMNTYINDIKPKSNSQKST